MLDAGHVKEDEEGVERMEIEKEEEKDEEGEEK